MATVHAAPAASEPPQVFVWAKLEALAPPSVTPLSEAEAEPGLLTVSVWAAEVCPAAAAKVRELLDSEIWALDAGALEVLPPLPQPAITAVTTSAKNVEAFAPARMIF